MALPTPLIYYSDGSGNVNLTYGQVVTVTCGSSLTIGLQATAGVNSVTYQVRGPGTVYWSIENRVYQPTPNLAWTFTLPITPTMYTITILTEDGDNVSNCVNYFEALAGAGTGVPTGTGVYHITGGVADAGAMTGTALQFLQVNSAGTNQAFFTFSGDVRAGASNGALIVQGLQGNPVSNAAITNAYALVSNGSVWAPAQISASLGITGVLPVANGGTSANTLTAHAVLLGEGTSAVGFAGPNAATGANALPLLSQGAGANPTFAALNLSGIAVTGTLPVGLGGTGDAALTQYAVLVGTTTGIGFEGPNAASGTNALPLVSQGASAFPIFAALNLSGTGVAGVLPYTGGGTGLSTLGTNTQVLTSNGSAIVWANQAGGGGTIPVTQGGTGLTTLTQYALLVGTGTANVSFVGPSTPAGVPLVSGGLSANPTFAPLNLSGTGITGLLPLGNITGGTNGQVLVTTGTTPSWNSMSGDVAFSAVTPGKTSVISLTGNVSTQQLYAANTAANFGWDASTVTPGIGQLSITSSSAAQPLYYSAQGNNGSGAGGDLQLASGFSTSGLSGTVWLQIAGANTLGMSPTGGIVLNTAAVNVAANVVLSTAQLSCPVLICASTTLTANTYMTFPANSPTQPSTNWIVNCKNVTFGGNFLFAKTSSGGGLSHAISPNLFAQVDMFLVQITQSGASVAILA